jgi:Ca2+/H+ antiporter
LNDSFLAKVSLSSIGEMSILAAGCAGTGVGSLGAKTKNFNGKESNANDSTITKIMVMTLYLPVFSM